MSKRVRIFCLLGLLALAGVVCRFALSQPTKSAEDDKLGKLFAQAQPHLESVLGCSLPVQPEFRVLALAEARKLPGWEVNAFIRWRFPSLQGTSRQDSFTIAHETMTQAMVARHMEGTGIIAAVPDNRSVIAGWDLSLSEVNSSAFLQLELVHSVARMVLEKKYNLLDRKFDAHSLEELKIYQALQEGRAQWLTWQVAQRLGSEDLFPLMAQRWLHAPDVSPDPQVRAAVQTCLHQKHWAYSRGKDFFVQLDMQGVAEAEKIVFARPPQQQEMIERPELYVPVAASDSDLQALFTSLPQKHPVGNWKAIQQPWTPTVFRQVAGLFKEHERAAKVVDGWRDGRALIWSEPKSGGKYVGLSAVRFDSEKSARAYYHFAAELQRKRDELAGKSAASPFRVIESTFQDVSLAGTDEALRNDKVLQPAPGGAALPATMVLVRAGNVVVEFNWHGAAADMVWAGQLMAELRESGKAN